jgi:nucleoside-diphosphate-sugar epimerase
MKKAKIYVAGHTGLIGSAIVRKLLEKDYRNINCYNFNWYIILYINIVDKSFS